MNCEFYGKEKSIDYYHAKTNTHCHKVECDRQWHIYYNGKLHNDIAFMIKCPTWVSQLRGDYIDTKYPISGYAKEQTFENFDIAFNNHKVESESCQSFLDSEDKILLLAGPSHIGKTHLANATLNKSRANGYPGTFKTIKELENLFIAISGFQTHSEAMNNFNQLKSIYFLVIDELNEINQRFVNEFQDLLDGRIQNNNKTVITTNLNPGSIQEIYGEKIFNRFGIKTKVIAMEGRKYGRQEKKQPKNL
ncbi:MAG TPA: ATP-binding protein [Bacteroidales bacterium]|nr:ATP-binding protein [Bacteroidales bacterium]